VVLKQGAKLPTEEDEAEIAAELVERVRHSIGAVACFKQVIVVCYSLPALHELLAILLADLDQCVCAQ